MKKFLVLYMMPYAGMGEWMKMDETARKVEEEKMKVAWDQWSLEHKDMLIETAGAGQMTKVTEGNSEIGHNDVMMYSLVQGENAETVAKIFETHPHFGIPNTWIEIMPANVLPGMQA
jgi:predicted secreted acid phosphatase